MDFSLDNFTAIAETAIADIKYPTVAAGLYEPIKYTMASGGKRLRPSLCLAAFSAVCHRNPELAVAQAIAIEMFHNFTLLHDDVMDNADIRRGRPTVHRRWGRNAAILSGDTMLTMAYILLGQNNPARFADIYELFNRTAMEIYQGQQLDVEFERRSDVTVDEYLEMIRLKTSVLIGCATRTGALLAEADDRTADAFYRYGEALGLAFQLRDDWLDTFGDPAVFGKEIGGDIVNNKKTWLLINALAEDPEAIAKAEEGSRNESEKIAAVTGIYKRLGLDKRCSELALKYSDDAIKALEGIDLDANAASFFTSLARKAATRDH